MVVRPLADEDGGGFMAYVPDPPGCMGDGATRDAAPADVQSAIMEWMDEAARLLRPILRPPDADVPTDEQFKR
jgi:predicted RNase H-like HicB family nuclease